VTFAELTPRKREVADLYCRGLSERQVAKKLGVSFNTAHSHIHQLFKKLGIHSRAELAVLSMQEPS
jgi:DNA-binding NarL/FixJ family response regulator